MTLIPCSHSRAVLQDRAKRLRAAPCRHRNKEHLMSMRNPQQGSSMRLRSGGAVRLIRGFLICIFPKLPCPFRMQRLLVVPSNVAQSSKHLRCRAMLHRVRATSMQRPRKGLNGTAGTRMLPLLLQVGWVRHPACIVLARMHRGILQKRPPRLRLPPRPRRFRQLRLPGRRGRRKSPHSSLRKHLHGSGCIKRAMADRILPRRRRVMSHGIAFAGALSCWSCCLSSTW